MSWSRIRCPSERKPRRRATSSVHFCWMTSKYVVEDFERALIFDMSSALIVAIAGPLDIASRCRLAIRTPSGPEKRREAVGLLETADSWALQNELNLRRKDLRSLSPPSKAQIVGGRPRLPRAPSQVVRASGPWSPMLERIKIEINLLLFLCILHAMSRMGGEVEIGVTPSPVIASHSGKEETATVRPGGSHFRCDLEALRGIAIALVLLYHFEVPLFSGGFVGVDVFFVLSGYLVTDRKSVV